MAKALKIEQMREWTADERAAKEKEWTQSLFTLRLQKATGQLENPMKIREVRKDVARLNRRVHPEILREIRRRITRARGWVVLDAALLFETGADALCDKIVFVSAPRALRARRTRSRGWAPGELARRERFQFPVAYKKKKADYVIDNTGPTSRTEEQTRKICDELRRSP